MPIPEGLAAWLAELSTLTALINISFAVGLTYMVIRAVRNSWPSVNNLVTFVNALGQLPTFMASTEEGLREVRHEVLPNNGGSFRDLADEIRIRLESLEAHVSKDLERLHRLESALKSRVAAREQAHPDSIELPTYTEDHEEG